MVFAKITGIVIILFGIVIGLNHFGIIAASFLGVNLVVVGIALFIAHEVYALIRNIFSDSNKIISTGVPLLFILVAASFFIKQSLPEALSSNVTLVISILMVAEGLYRLH